MIWTTGHEEWGARLSYTALFFFILSEACFSWPLLKKFYGFREGFWPRMLPLTDAARKALEGIDGSTMSMVARRQMSAPNGALCYMATKLAMNGLPIYGRQIPSSTLRPVSDDAWLSTEFIKDATAAEDKDSHQVTYEDLMVKHSDFTIAMKKLKEQHPHSS